jgi:NCAIR mutase (PurE)-related protein
MFSKILGRSKSDENNIDRDYAQIVQRISKMNLTDMRAYLKNTMSGFESSEDGLSEIMKHFLTRNDKNKRYVEIGDNDAKIKKVFDIVLLIATHKRITVSVVEQIQKFIEEYSDIIKKYDTDNKQIYASKLKDGLELAIDTINKMAEYNKKAKVLGE